MKKEKNNYRIFEDIGNVDISENDILEYDPVVLDKLLVDHTLSEHERHKTGDPQATVNIFWATSDYKEYGEGYDYHDKITPEKITGQNGRIVMPRVLKSRQQQLDRTKDKAEVFTPSWVCNAQNNLVDEAWFGRKDVFNEEFINADGEHDWRPTEGKIAFPDDKKTARRYVLDNVMEVTCGEAPYLVSRYDTTTGQLIPIEKRVGLLDRKLRIVNENVDNEKDWHEWARKAFQHTYGYEWQGDNLLLAREALLYTYIEYFMYRFNRRDADGRYIPGDDGELHVPTNQHIREACYWISWNIWQMDGLRYVVPDSCHEEVITDLFGGETRTPCPGCAAGTDSNHNGVQCIIRDWSVTKRPKDWEDNAWQGKSPAPWQKKTFRSLFTDNSETEI
jgi:hypothetical protein